MGKVSLWKYAVILLYVGGIAHGHHHHHHHHHHDQSDEYDLPREVPTRGYRYMIPKVESNYGGTKIIQRIPESRSPAPYGGYEDEYVPPLPPPTQYSRNEYRSQREPVPTFVPPHRSRAYIDDLPPVQTTCSECQDDDGYYSPPVARERVVHYNAGREVSYRPKVVVEECPCACGESSFQDCPCCSGGDCPYCSQGNCPCGGSPSQDVEDDGDCPYCQRHEDTYTEQCPCNCANEPETYTPRGRSFPAYQEFPPVSPMNERRGGYAPVPQIEDSGPIYVPPPPPPPTYTQMPPIEIQQPPIGQYRSVPMDDIPEVRRVVRPPMDVSLPPYEPQPPQRIQMQQPPPYIVKTQPEMPLPPVSSRILTPEESLQPNVPLSPPPIQTMRMSSDVPLSPPSMVQTMRIPPSENISTLPSVTQTMRIPSDVPMPPTNQPIQQVQQLPPQYVALDDNYPPNIQYDRTSLVKGVPSNGRRGYMSSVMNGRMKPAYLENLSYSEGC